MLYLDSILIFIKLQQEHVLTEIHSYVNQDHLPPDASSVNLTLKYLTACNSIFEKGFLSHKKVSIDEQEVLKNIQQGFAFYSGWLKSILDEGIVHIIVLQIHVHVIMCAPTDPKFNHADSQQKKFIAWQSK